MRVTINCVYEGSFTDPELMPGETSPLTYDQIVVTFDPEFQYAYLSLGLSTADVIPEPGGPAPAVLDESLDAGLVTASQLGR